MKMALLSMLIALAATGCGGGSGSNSGTGTPAPLLSLTPGVYELSFNQLQERGEIVVSSDAQALYTSKPFVGTTTFTITSTNASANLKLLDRPIDDLNNEFPSAKDASMTRAISLTPGSAGAWGATGISMTPITRSAPPITSMPKLWRHRNLYRFSGAFLDYTAQIDIATDGTLTGFDTNDCQFTGSLSDAGATYRATLHASNCGATNLYIENYTYSGVAYINDGPPRRLIIVGVNSAGTAGLSLDLGER